MSEACGGLAGVLIEDKTWSLAVHWRAARPKSAARARILEAAARITGARVVHGKDVVNLVHPEAAHKGAAIVEIRRQLGCDTVIYVGDDVTDDDVFALGEPGRLLPVRVGRSRQHRGFLLKRIDPSDKRRSRLVLTQQGRAIYARRGGTVESEVEKALETLRPQDVAAALRVLTTIGDQLAP